MIASLRKADILLFFSFLALAALIAALPLVRSSGNEQKVRIISGGELVGIYPLDNDIDVEVKHDGHLNIVSIKDKKVHMEYSDCRNQICVHTGEITQTGDTIVCLPNYVIVEITGEKEGGDKGEVLFPLNAGIPGIKLGLANLVPLVIMYRMDARYAFAANLIRVLLAGLLFSGLFAALYSLAGSCVSFLVMYLLKKTDKFSIIGVSMAGGVFHNLGQLAVAILLVSGPQLIHYMPVLILSGIAAGIIVGIGAFILADRLPAKLFL